MGQAHRERILKAFKPGCRILEWGSGSSTLWFADRLPAGATLASVDHDLARHQKVGKRIGPRSNVRLLLCPPLEPVGPSPPEEEENPASLQDYVHAVDEERFDVILVDGVARNACMEQASRLLKPGGKIFLHDAQRHWYDYGKSHFIAHGTAGSCPEYPSPLLWWGGLEMEAPRFSVGALPIVISFFTSGTGYEDEAARLRSSLEQLGMEAEIVGVPPLGTWERNCAYKARFIRDTYFRLDRPVLWLDADAVVRAHPLLLSGAEPDFAVSRCDGWQFNSASVYFNRTGLSQLLLETWVRHCDARPDIWDQIHLDRAWEEVTARHPLYTMWLPQPYAKIFDRSWESDMEAGPIVVEQFQASRRLKSEVTQGTPRRMRPPSPELVAARRAGRPRSSYYDQQYILQPQDPMPDPWAVGSESEAGLVASNASFLQRMASRLRKP